MNIYDMLQHSNNEKDVENYYRKFMEKHFDSAIRSPHNVDGYLNTTLKKDGEEKQLSLIMEFKYNGNFSYRSNVSQVLLQVLFYMKKIENSGDTPPNVIFVGDQNDYFILQANELSLYLEEDINWEVAASSAYKHNPDLLGKINSNSKINPFIFQIDSKFDFNSITNEIKKILFENNKKIDINENNIYRLYLYFIQKVIINEKKYDANTLVSIFISTIIDKRNTYLRPHKKNTLIVNSEEYSVYEDKYNSFFNQFKQDYKPSERRIFTEISDRLIEETNRRKKGEYYTPTSFVQMADEMLSEQLGRNWKKTTTVWDPAWGTGNLTRDYDFKKLFVSTINKSDLEIGAKYNKPNEKFVYDFLNEDPETFDPLSFLELDNKSEAYPVFDFMSAHPEAPFLFFLNPPYATGGNANAKNVKSKKNISATEISKYMKADNIRVSEQLYAQFLYRIMKMKQNFGSTNMYIGIFCPTLFLTGSKYKKFRKEFLTHFEFVDGSIFKASHFADVKGTWAIDFSIWKSKSPSSAKEIKNTFPHKVIDISETGHMQILGKKNLYNLDGITSLQDYLGSNSKLPNSNNIQYKKTPVFSSAFKHSKKISDIRRDSLGVLVNDTNNIEATTKGSYIMPSRITRNLKTVDIIAENFEKAMVVLAAGNVQVSTWINQKDEFKQPNTDHPNFKRFAVNSVIFSIFSPKNNITSYRDIEIDNELYSGINEWFFMSRDEIREISDDSNNISIYEDTYSFGGERFVYEYLNIHKDLITEEGAELLNRAKKMITQTMKYREDFSLNNPLYNLNSWDASWVQLKKLFETFSSNDLDVFNVIFKNFQSNLKIMADELDFIEK